MGWEPFSGRLIIAHKNLPIGVDVDFHLRALKFKWSQLQDAPSCSKGGIRGWWEGVKGFRRAGGGVLVVEILAGPSYSLGRPPLKAADLLWSSPSLATRPPDPPPCPGHAR